MTAKVLKGQIPLVAYAIYGVDMDAREGFAVLLALAGFYLLSGLNTLPNIGDVLVFLCALAFATEIAMIAHHSRACDATSLAS